MGDSIPTKTEAWNVADRFTRENIEMLIEDINKFQTIAKYGVLFMEEKTNYSFNELLERRVEALSRLSSTIRQLMENSKFKIKKDELYLYHEWGILLDVYDETIHDIYTSKERDTFNEDCFDINEEKFFKIYKKLGHIKQEILIVLDHAGFIYKISDDFNIDDVHNSIREGG